MIPLTRFHFNFLAGFDIKTFNSAHFHYVAFHRHGVNLNLTCNGCGDRLQDIISLALIFNRKKSRTIRLIADAGARLCLFNMNSAGVCAVRLNQAGG